MNFQSFKDQLPISTSRIFLGGKRNVREEDKPKLVLLGKLLASELSYMIFRSGNAEGSDALFAEGVCRVDPTRFESILPYENHRKKNLNTYSQSYSMDQVDLAADDDLVYYTKSNKANANLINRYMDGHKDRNGMKAAYLFRDTMAIIGSKSIPLEPVSFAFFYIDPADPLGGGTGHTIKVCQENNIPYLTQEIWMSWV
jgi:hypothetical protein